MCTDWEMGEFYRRWRSGYADKWEEKFSQTYESEMIHRAVRQPRTPLRSPMALLFD
jgi:hypothetical protein